MTLHLIVVRNKRRIKYNNWQNPGILVIKLLCNRGFVCDDTDADNIFFAAALRIKCCISNGTVFLQKGSFSQWYNTSKCKQPLAQCCVQTSTRLIVCLCLETWKFRWSALQTMFTITLIFTIWNSCFLRTS